MLVLETRSARATFVASDFGRCLCGSSRRFRNESSSLLPGCELTLGEWNTRVQEGRVNLAPSTQDSDGSVIRSLILPSFEHAVLSAIEPGDVRAWVAELVAAGYSPSTIRRAYTLLQLALELAVEDGRLAPSPCRRISLPRIEQSEKRFLSIEEVEHLAEAIRPRYRTFVLAGAYTGLRPGELATLRIDRLDLLRRQLRVEEPLKTPAARRTVNLPSFLAEELAAHLATYPGQDRFVFSAPEGGPQGVTPLPGRV